MPKKLILFPFGGNAREALTVIRDINKIKREWEVFGFIDDDPKTWGKIFLGVKVLGARAILKKFKSSHVLAVPGREDTYLARQATIEGLKVSPSRFAAIIHPRAVISDGAKVGYNIVIMANVIASCDVKIGNHCVILPNSVISHDTSIGNYCFVGSNASISGFVAVGKSCYIGSGAKIRGNVTIGEKSLVGLGAVVIKNVPQKVVVAGNPAKILNKSI